MCFQQHGIEGARKRLEIQPIWPLNISTKDIAPSKSKT
jgi:hypothetical protein